MDYSNIMEQLRAEHARLCESIAAFERLEVSRRPTREKPLNASAKQTPGKSTRKKRTT